MTGILIAPAPRNHLSEGSFFVYPWHHAKLPGRRGLRYRVVYIARRAAASRRVGSRPGSRVPDRRNRAVIRSTTSAARFRFGAHRPSFATAARRITKLRFSIYIRGFRQWISTIRGATLQSLRAKRKTATRRSPSKNNHLECRQFDCAPHDRIEARSCSLISPARTFAERNCASALTNCP